MRLLPCAGVVSLLLLSACVAEVVQKQQPRKGPVPEVGYVDTGGGEVRYSVEGWSLIVASRRNVAFRRMRSICKGLRPKIVDEFTHQDVDVPYAGDDLDVNLQHGMEHYNVAPYHHIVFDCVAVSSDSLRSK